MINLDTLHYIAMHPYTTARCIGKSYYNMVIGIQKLELLPNINNFVVVVKTLNQVGYLLGLAITICEDLEISVLRVTHNDILTEFGWVRFVIGNDRSRGLKCIKFEDDVL